MGDAGRVDKKDMKKTLDGKVIVIVGGTKGVGRAAAEECAASGAKIIIGGRDKDAASAVLESAGACGSEGLFVYTDSAKAGDCERLFSEAYRAFGKIDGLYYYSGVTTVSPLDACDEETFDEIMGVNFKGAFFCCREAVKYMRMNGGGSIVLTGSAHAWGGQKDRAAYACSKGALKTLMEHIAHNYANERIRCNYLVLGWTPTEGELSLRAAMGETESELRERAEKILPMGRMCENGDYTDAIVNMLSDASGMMTGSVLRITAGEYI